MPGKVASHHELKMYSLPWAIMEPHAGSGGCTPRPRKLSDASIKMTHATRSVATTMTDENVLGKISRHIMCRSRAPTALAASTYSTFFAARTSPRTMRGRRHPLFVYQRQNEIAEPGPHDAIRAMASTKYGNASKMSDRR